MIFKQFLYGIVAMSLIFPVAMLAQFKAVPDDIIGIDAHLAFQDYLIIKKLVIL